MSAMLLSQAVDQYLAARKGRCSLTTVQNDGYVLHRFAATVANGRDIQVRNLTPEHVVNWFNALMQPHLDRSRVARTAIQSSTWNYYRTRIKSFVAYCSRRGLTHADVLSEVPPKCEARKIRQQPSVNELLAMLGATTDPRDRALLACAMNTGLRASEIASLRVGDVHLGTLNLHVWVSKSQVEDNMPITSDLADELHDWLSTYARLLDRPLSGADFLFPTSTGPRYRWRTLPDGVRERYHAPSVYRPHKPVAKLHRIAQGALSSVGLPTKHEGIHTFRRAFARVHYDRLVSRGGHDGAIRVVMTSLHHTNVSTTERYLGVTSELKARDESLRGRSLLVPIEPSEDSLINGIRSAVPDQRAHTPERQPSALLLS